MSKCLNVWTLGGGGGEDVCDTDGHGLLSTENLIPRPLPPPQ